MLSHCHQFPIAVLNPLITKVNCSLQRNLLHSLFSSSAATTERRVIASRMYERAENNDWKPIYYTAIFAYLQRQPLDDYLLLRAAFNNEESPTWNSSLSEMDSFSTFVQLPHCHSQTRSSTEVPPRRWSIRSLPWSDDETIASASNSKWIIQRHNFGAVFADVCPYIQSLSIAFVFLSCRSSLAWFLPIMCSTVCIIFINCTHQIKSKQAHDICWLACQRIAQ